MFYTNVARKGNNILLRGYNNDGKPIKNKFKFAPHLFIKSKNRTDFKSMYGDYLELVEFDDISEMKQYINEYEDILDLYGNYNPINQFISQLFDVPEIEYNYDYIKIVSIDIETTNDHGQPNPYLALEKINLITVKNFHTKKKTTFTTLDVNVNDFDSEVIKVSTEKLLLEKFVLHFSKDYPDVITGYFTDNFDIPYICNRILKVLSETYLYKLSPWGIVNSKEETNEKNGKKDIFYEILGISSLDYSRLYPKLTLKKLENKKLDTVAKEELENFTKLENPYSTFKEFYENDPKLFTEYNIRDVDVVDELEEETRVINLAIDIAYQSKCNFEDVYSPVKLWDSILYNELMLENIVVDNKNRRTFNSGIIGAYVKEMHPSVYDYICSIDAISLYPSILMALNMSPETLIDGCEVSLSNFEKILRREIDTNFLKEKNYSMAANEQCFDRSIEGIFPKSIKKKFTKRNADKSEMLKYEGLYQKTKSSEHKRLITIYDIKQKSKKVLLNCLYGVTTNEFFRFFDNRIAEGITSTGQLILKTIERDLEKHLQNETRMKEKFIFYGDTDSIYLTLAPIIEKYYKDHTIEEKIDIMDVISKEIVESGAKMITDNLSDYLNFKEHAISFKREALASRGIWTAKKRYAMNVYNSEGVSYNPPKLKILGLEIIRSSTPNIVKAFLKESVKLSLNSNNDELREYINEIKNKWKTYEIEDIARPTGINELTKYLDESSLYSKGTPAHIKAGIIYNNFIENNNLTNYHNLITEGDSIKYVYLKEPNPFKDSIIGWKDKIPKELELEKWIDYDKMFDINLIKPLDKILKAINWKLEEPSELEFEYE